MDKPKIRINFLKPICGACKGRGDTPHYDGSSICYTCQGSGRGHQQDVSTPAEKWQRAKVIQYRYNEPRMCDVRP